MKGQKPRQSNPSAVFLSALLFLLAVCAFLPALKNGFINLDDPIYVTGNVHVNQGLTWPGLVWAFHGTDGGIWLPLTWFSHMLDCQLYGLKPWGHHLTSILFHAANTVLVFLWLRRMTGAMWRSFVLAALFGLHPLRVESVAWVSERKDVLSALFWFLALCAYTEYVKKSQAGPSAAKNFYALALLFFILGLMAKPMLVTLPFVLLLLDYWPLNRFDGKKNIPSLVMEKWPFFFLSALACIVAFVTQKNEKAVIFLARLPVFDRIENAIVSYVRYIGKSLWPENLCVFYPHPVQWPMGIVFSSATLLLIISLIFVWQRRRHPYLLVGWLWFLGTLIPVIGLVQIGQQAMADRYTYIPQIGLLLCLVWGVHALSKTWKRQSFILSVTATATILACVTLTCRQIGWWRDSETLFRRTIAVTTDNITAHIMLGFALDRAGKAKEAVEEYHFGLRDNPKDATLHDNLGLDLYRLGRIDEAIVDFKKAIEINHTNAEFHINLGTALFQKGRIDEAIAQYQDALEINSSSDQAHNNLANAFLQKGLIDDAIVHYQKASEINPTNAEVYNDLGTAFLQKKRIDEAIVQYQKTLKINPDNAEAYYNLGVAFFQNGQFDEAVANYQKALEINPNFVEAHNNLGTTLTKIGRVTEAIVQYQKALELQPDLAVTCNKLAWVLATCPSATIRDGNRAIELAERSNQLTGGTNPTALATLAAAYAETGKFTEAISTARQALDLAGAQNNNSLINAIQAQIKLYQAGSPFRDSSLTNAP